MPTYFKRLTLLVMVVLCPTVAISEDFIAEDSDVSAWIVDIWEHKVNVAVSWNYLNKCVFNEHTNTLKGFACPIEGFSEVNISNITIQRINGEAQRACDFYKRDAMGPLNISRPNEIPFRFDYMYACALR